MLKGFANLESITENMTKDEKKRIYAKDKIIPEGMDDYINMNLSENETFEHSGIISDIFS